MTGKRSDPERTRRNAAYLHRVAAESRQTAAEMDQMAAKWERDLEPKDGPWPCCEQSACMVCGIDSPPGHCHVLLPDSRAKRSIVIGRVCSKHTILELAMTDKFMLYIEGEADHE